jgi:hypothetical protein
MKTIIAHLLVSAAGMAAAVADEIPRQRALQAGDGTPVALWQPSPRPNKPYIAQLYAPGPRPVALLDDSPPDHFHHHGLMFAISVDGTDFWTEKKSGGSFGRQVPVKTDPATDASGFTRRLQWVAPAGEVLLEETRSVAVRAAGEGDGAVHWLDWTSVLTPVAGREAVELSGHHYFGLGMRFLPAWSGKGTFHWQDVAGQKVVRGDEKLTPGQWCAVRGAVDGRPTTVLLIDGPGNARPVRWFTMSKPFCYLSATLGLDTEPAGLKAGESWTLRYGVAVMTGNADRERLDKLAREWLARVAKSQTKPQPTNKP